MVSNGENGAPPQAAHGFTEELTKAASSSLKFLKIAQARRSQEAYCSLVTSSGTLKLSHKNDKEVEASWTKLAAQSVDTLVTVTSNSRLGEKPLASKEERQGYRRRAEEALREGRSLVEFEAPNFYYKCGAKSVRIPVRRIGDLQARVEITCKITSSCEPWMNDKRYPIVVEAGESLGWAELPVLSTTEWTAEDFYHIIIEEHEHWIDLGTNHYAHVWMINTEPFPDQIRGFLYYNFLQYPQETIKGVLLCLCPAVAYYFTTQNLSSLVDCVSGNGCVYLGIGLADVRPNPVVFLLGIELVIFALMHAQEYLFRTLRLGGKAVRKMRYNVFKTMLNMAEEERRAYDRGDIPKIMDTDVESTMKEVWVGAFKLTGQIANAMMKIFITYQVASTADETIVKVFLYLAVFVMIILGVAVLRVTRSKEIELKKRAKDNEEHWHALVHMCEATLSLITQYSAPSHMADTVDKKHGEINAANTLAVDRCTFTVWILKYLFLFCRFGAVGMLGGEVLNGGVNPGSFIMINKVLADVGKNLLTISTTYQTFNNGQASLTRIASVLQRKTMRRQLHESEEMMQAAAEEGRKVKPEGEQNIKFDNVTYCYPSISKLTDHAVIAVHPVSLEIEPNRLIAISRIDRTMLRVKDGASGPAVNQKGVVGIDTLFKLMSQQIMPLAPVQGRDPGFVVMPQRWRKVYVPSTPVLFNGTLFFNIYFGVICPCKDKKEDQKELADHLEALVPRKAVWEAARRMGMSSHLIPDTNNLQDEAELLKEDIDVGTDGEKLKLSDRLVVCILRAMVARVDLIMMAGVLDILGEDQGRKVLQELSDYINTGALPGTYEDFPQMHRKTVIYSTRFSQLQEMSDQVIWFEFGGAAPERPVHKPALADAPFPMPFYFEKHPPDAKPEPGAAKGCVPAFNI